MTDSIFYFTALLLAGIPAWALKSGTAFGAWWWRPSVRRADQPTAYWILVAAQSAILVVFLFTGRAWHLR